MGKLHPAIKSQTQRFLENPCVFHHSHLVQTDATNLVISFKLAQSKTITTYIIYDLADISFPPDILVENYDISFTDLKPEITEASPPGLLLKIKQLCVKEERRQIDMMGINEVSFDISSFFHIKDIEMAVSQDGMVVLLAPLKHVIPNEKRQVTSFLQVKYTIVNNKVKEKIANAILNPLYTLDFKMPKLKDQPLIECYNRILQKLNDSSKTPTNQSLSKREAFVNALLTDAVFKRGILEYDDISFRTVSFIIDVYFGKDVDVAQSSKQQFAVVNVHLSDGFPYKSPKVYLVSSYVYAENSDYVPAAVKIRYEYDKSNRVSDTIEEFSCSKN